MKFDNFYCLSCGNVIPVLKHGYCSMCADELNAFFDDLFWTEFDYDEEESFRESDWHDNY
jgi:hypothetical protein